MSIPAVLRTHQQLTGLIQKLVEQGVLKKEETPAGSRWVDARVSDDAALARWGLQASNF